MSEDTAPKNAAPPPRGQSVRAALLEALSAAGSLGGALSARELSAAVRIAEREVPPHLEHLARTLKSKGSRLEHLASECLGCGFVFEARARLTAPGSCPECRATRITPPRFRVIT